MEKIASVDNPDNHNKAPNGALSRAMTNVTIDTPVSLTVLVTFESGLWTARLAVIGELIGYNVLE